MNAPLPKRDGAAQTEVAPEYGPLGLNHCLRIGSIGYVYDPEFDAWTHDYRTPEGFFAQHILDAYAIHAIIFEGRYKVTVWDGV